MRILSVNKFYYILGGTERYMFDLNRLLEERGHEIIPFSTANAENQINLYEPLFVSEINFFDKTRLTDKLKAAARVIYSLEARRKIDIIITRTKPQIAHLHNIAHQLSPSILHELFGHGIPVVQTLHDYKMICPTYTMFTGNEVCERCLDGHFYNAIFHRCNRGSLAASLINSIEMYVHNQVLRSYDKVALFISPSSFLRSKMIESGMDPKRIVQVPYFIDLERYSPRYDNDAYLLFFGQLIPVKGLEIVLKAMRQVPNARLIVAGRGEQEATLRSIAGGFGLDVSFVGFQSGQKLCDLIRGSLAVVVPSLWYENQPYSIIESFAYGKPVVGSRLGGMTELIDDKVDGLLFKPGDPDDLATKLRWLMDHPKQISRMGRSARDKVERRFDPVNHYNMIMEIYEHFAD